MLSFAKQQIFYNIISNTQLNFPKDLIWSNEMKDNKIKTKRATEKQQIFISHQHKKRKDFNLIIRTTNNNILLNQFQNNNKIINP